MAWTHHKLAEGWAGRLTDLDIEAYSRAVRSGACLNLELHRNQLEPIEATVAWSVLDDLRQGVPAALKECPDLPFIQALRWPFNIFAFLSVAWQKAPGVWPVLRDALQRAGVADLVYWRLDVLEPVTPGAPQFQCGVRELWRRDCTLADLWQNLKSRYGWLPYALGAAAVLVAMAPVAAYYGARVGGESRRPPGQGEPLATITRKRRLSTTTRRHRLRGSNSRR